MVPEAAATAPCPCGSGAPYASCCGPLLDGAAHAGSALALLRSRYTAYTLGRNDYLDATWHPATREEHDPDAPNAAIRWLGLEVLQLHDEGEQARIEFVARFALHGRIGELRELSRFERSAGRWYYRDGSRPAPARRDAAKVGRNDPCPCGSGRKFKKCCGLGQDTA